MKLSLFVRAQIAEFEKKFPIPASDDARRAWTHRLCEQIVYSFPGQGYCHKSAGAGRPHSTDVLAQITDAGLVGWDLIDGTTGQLIANPDNIDLAGQIPEPVTGVNHLGVAPPVPVDPGTPPDPVDPELPPWASAADLAKHDADIKAALAQAVAAVATLPGVLKAQVQALTFDGEAKLFGQTIKFTLRPRVNT